MAEEPEQRDAGGEASSPRIFLRERPGDLSTKTQAPVIDLPVEALRQEGGVVRVTATTEISLSRRGPFEPLSTAIVGDAAVRARLADGLGCSSAVAYRPIRPLLYVGLVPLLMLAELDRELLATGHSGARTRLVLGLSLGLALGIDFARRVPRHPGMSAAVLFWVAARYVHVLAVTCGGGANPVAFAAPALAGSVGLLLLTRAPRPGRLADEILSKLGVDPSDAIRARLGEPPTRLLVRASVAAAVALPLLLAALHRIDASLWTTGAVLVLYGGAVPELVERLLEKSRPRRARARPGRLAFAALLGFALTTGLVSGAQRAFDSGIYLQRCVRPAEFEREGKRLLEAQAAEVRKGIARAKDRLPVLLMTIFAVPLAEERLYRGLLLRVLTRRYGERLGLLYSALVFGGAHLVVYKIAAYQAVLLGFGFGAAYLEGGLLAAVLAHGLWNLHLIF